LDPAIPGIAFAVLISFAVSAESYRSRALDALDFPREPVSQPGIRLLELIAVFNALPKHAVLVTNTVTNHWQAQRRTAVEKTGREPAEAAVAKTRVAFALGNVFEREAEPIQGIDGGAPQVQADQCV